jgi:hypothetical protein
MRRREEKIADLQSWGHHKTESVLLDSIYVTIRIHVENVVQQSRKVDTKNHKTERDIHESRQMQ